MAIATIKKIRHLKYLKKEITMHKLLLNGEFMYCLFMIQIITIYINSKLLTKITQSQETKSILNFLA